MELLNESFKPYLETKRKSYKMSRINSIAIFRIADQLELSFGINEKLTTVQKKAQKEVVSKLPTSFENLPVKKTSEFDGFQISYYVEQPGPLACLCLHQKEISSENVYLLMEEILTSFVAAHGEQIEKATKKFEFMKYGIAIEEIKAKFEAKLKEENPVEEKVIERKSEKPPAIDTERERKDQNEEENENENQSKLHHANEKGKQKLIQKNLFSKEGDDKKGMTFEDYLERGGGGGGREEGEEAEEEEEEEAEEEKEEEDEDGEEAEEEEEKVFDSPFRDPNDVIFEKILEGDPTFALIKFAQTVRRRHFGRYDYLKFTNRLIVFVTKFIDDTEALAMTTNTYRACEILENPDCELAVAKCIKRLCAFKKSDAFFKGYQKVKELLAENPTGVL